MNSTILKNDETPGHLARRFQQIAVAAFQTEMELIKSDITPVQFAAMAALAEHPGIDQATLAVTIAVDRATITGVVDRLQAKGLVDRRVSLTDRRARLLELSAAGIAALEWISPSVEKAQMNILQHLSEADAAMLMNLLKIVTSTFVPRRDGR